MYVCIYIYVCICVCVCVCVFVCVCDIMTKVCVCVCVCVCGVHVHASVHTVVTVVDKARRHSLDIMTHRHINAIPPPGFHVGDWTRKESFIQLR